MTETAFCSAFPLAGQEIKEGGRRTDDFWERVLAGDRAGRLSTS